MIKTETEDKIKIMWWSSELKEPQIPGIANLIYSLSVTTLAQPQKQWSLIGISS